MKTIWKFPLRITDEQSIIAPVDMRPLCVQLQRDIPVLWAEVDPESLRRCTKVWIHGTGHPLTEPQSIHVTELPGPKHYLGTFQSHGGALVFHIYTEAEPRR